MKNIQAWQELILNSINGAAYGQKLTSQSEKIMFFYFKFQEDCANEIQDYGILTALMRYLQTPLTAIDLPHDCYEILDMARELGSLPENSTRIQEDKILAEYWGFVAFQIFELFKKHAVPVYN